MTKGTPMDSTDPKRGLVIITGGDSGIGAAVALQTAHLGHHVLINYLENRSAAREVESRIRLSGGQASTCQADIGSEEGVLALYTAADNIPLPLIGLVNNAGVSGGFSRLDSLSEETVRRVFAVNVIGATLCSREAVLRLSTKHGGRGGSIVNVSSIAAKLGGAGEWVHYAASKGAVDTLTIGLAREVAAEGIRVNAVSPGLIATRFHGQAGAPNRVAQMTVGIPMGRAGTPEEVADVIVWLMSDRSNYVTGAIVPVGGGR